MSAYASVSEAGSSQITTSTCCAACENCSTEPAMPGAVSTTMKSSHVVRSPKARTSPRCVSLSSSASWVIPEAAGTTLNPCGASSTTSSSVQLPAITSASVSRGVSPRNTWTLARPRSPSSSMTSLPREASEAARFTAPVVLPTPPLPPVTAMTWTGLACMEPTCCNLFAPISRSAHTALHDFVIRARAVVAGNLDRPAHQRVRARRRQIFGNALAIADVGHRQLVAHQRRQHAAQAHRFVDLGDHAGRGPGELEALDHFVDGAGLGAGGQYQRGFDARL